MKSCLLLGRPNAGKTAFLLTFASYLGAEHLDLRVLTSTGAERQYRYTLKRAQRELVSATPHTTRHLQGIQVQLPGQKGLRTLELMDSTGLVPGIHPDPALRRAMAQTIAQVRQANLILHVIDAAEAADSCSDQNSWLLEKQIAAFAQPRGNYAILATKMDLPAAAMGLATLRTLFPQVPLFPISAQTRLGFKEVKRYVQRFR